MEPVEINAGAYYLRQLRADDRMDDRSALVRSFSDPEVQRWVGARANTMEEAAEYVERRATQWHEETRCSWAVADQVTGALLAEVGLARLDLGPRAFAEVSCWTHPDHRGRGVITTALGAVLRFAFGGLGLHRLEYWHGEGNDASQTVALRCGFTFEGRLREAMVIDGERRDSLVYSMLATDPSPRAG